jgi:hypothetical protein
VPSGSCRAGQWVSVDVDSGCELHPGLGWEADLGPQLLDRHASPAARVVPTEQFHHAAFLDIALRSTHRRYTVYVHR